MKMKKYLILVVVSLIAIAGPEIGTGGTQKPSIDKKKSRLRFLEGVFFAQETQMFMRVVPDKKVLQEVLSDIGKTELHGIRGVMVKVGKLPETERYGLTRQALQTDTELRLRQYGIKVMTQEEAISNTEDLNKESFKEVLKQMVAYTKGFIDLLDSGQYEKALKQMKEPDKSLIESLLNEESEERFMDSVLEYITKQEKYYKSSYLVAGPPMLVINVLPLIFEQRGTAVAYVSVDLIRGIVLTRGSSTFLAYAVLWERGSIISRGLDNLSEVRDEIRDLVDEFINDYLAANPEHEPTIKKSRESSEKKLTTGSTRGVVTVLSYDGKNPFVQIDDQIKLFREGDTIYGVKIVKIHKDKVVFEKEGTEKTIRWTQKIGEAQKEHWE